MNLIPKFAIEDIDYLKENKSSECALVTEDLLTDLSNTQFALL